MTLKTKIMTGLLLVSATLGYAQSNLGSTMRAFYTQEGYRAPVATLMGTLLNSGWQNSARVGKGFGWSFSLGIPLAYVSSDDKSFQVDTNSETGMVSYKTAPTIFGSTAGVTYYHTSPTYGYVQDSLVGDKDVRKQTVMPWFLPQLSFSYNYFRGSLRGWWLPSISVLGGYSLLGFGGQYDYTHFLPPKVHENNFSLSAAVDLTKWSLSYEPQSGNMVQGKANLDGFSSFTCLVGGWRYQIVEVFTEIGYETSSFDVGGSLVDNSQKGNRFYNIQPVAGHTSTSGANGFRMSLNVALHLGTWHPLLGQSIGAQSGTIIDPIHVGTEGAD